MGPTHLRSLVQAMLRVQYEQRGVGLAAPQIGLGPRLVVIDAGDREPLVLINPRIIDREDKEDVAFEGCLSIPGWEGEVSRPVAVKARRLTRRNGESIEYGILRV